MRRQRAEWTFVVISILCIMYGAFFAIKKYNEDRTFFIVSLVICLVGVAMFISYFTLNLISFKRKKNTKKEEIIVEEKHVEEEKQEEPQKVIPPKRDYEYVSSHSSRKSSIYDDNYSSGYVKLVGHGPVLEISGNRIRDMRSNTYYRIQDNYVYQDGSGVIYEISGSKIRNVSGGYLFEISGSSINKIYGGFFASISGNYITKYDSSIKYETTCSLNTKQLLIIAALLFE